MKKNWGIIFALILNVVLLIQVIRLDGKVDALEEKIAVQSRDTRDFLYDWEDRVYYTVQEAVKNATKQAVDFSFTPAGIDKAKRSLLADLSVTLREWSADTQVTMLVTLNGSVTEIPMTHEAAGVYTGELSLVVSENGDVKLAVQIENGESTIREELAHHRRVSDLLPISSGATGSSWEEYEDGVLKLYYYSFLPYDGDSKVVPVLEPTFRLYRNNELVLERNAVANEDYEDGNEGMSGEWFFNDSEENVPTSIPCGEGDEVWLMFACTDSYGIHYEFPVNGDRIENGEVVELNTGVIEPILTWN